jgi:hypothetical protein
MIPVRTIALVLWIVCLTVPAWADFRAGEDAYNRGDYAAALHEWRPLAERGDASAQYNLGGLYANGQGVPQDHVQARQWYEKAAVHGTISATGLGISSTGKFTIAGTETFLLGISYFDALDYRTSDIDTLSTRGFNNLRIFTDWANDDGTPGDQTVCNANGSIKSTAAATINALIDYAETKTMTVTVVILNELSDSWMTTEAARLACVTSTVNAFKAQALVMFDVVQEHDYSFTGSGVSLTPDEVKVYNDQARAACATCIIFSSVASPMSHPQDSTANIVSSTIGEKVENGENVLAIHDYRSSNWWSVTGARVTAYRNYLASIGKQNIPVIFDEPNRWGADNNSTETEFNTAAAQAKAAGAAMWVFHHGASFDMSASSLFAQLNATETAITLSMAAALSGSKRSLISLSSQHPE